MLAAGLAVVLTGGVGGGAAPAVAAPGPAAPGPAVVRWSPALNTGDPVGVELTAGGAQLAADRRAPDAALPPDGLTRPLGLLTFPARAVDVPVDRVDVAVDLSAGTAAAVAVDVRGLRADGAWTEWVTAVPTAPTAPAAGPTLHVTLPAPVTGVQARLVLVPAASGPVTQVAALHLAAYPAAPSLGAQARTPTPPERYRIFATREGLVGGTTANGHRIVARDLFVALPSRRALAPRNTGDYTVEVCASTGRCAFAPVWDVGPWNTRDDYWNAPNVRESWPDLTQGVPEAQAARTGYHGGKDQFGRTVRNPAGIDLADGVFAGALGLTDNAWVTVDYLWTGNGPLATVPLGGRADLRGAPNPTAPVVGVVAGGAAVPLQCKTGRWLRIGAGQFLPVAAVPKAQWPPHLASCR